MFSHERSVWLTSPSLCVPVFAFWLETLRLQLREDQAFGPAPAAQCQPCGKPVERHDRSK